MQLGFWLRKMIRLQIDNHLNLDNTIIQSQSRWLSVRWALQLSFSMVALGDATSRAA